MGAAADGSSFFGKMSSAHRWGVGSQWVWGLSRDQPWCPFDPTHGLMLVLAPKRKPETKKARVADLKRGAAAVVAWKWAIGWENGICRFQSVLRKLDCHWAIQAELEAARIWQVGWHLHGTGSIRQCPRPHSLTITKALFAITKIYRMEKHSGERDASNRSLALRNSEWCWR